MTPSPVGEKQLDTIPQVVMASELSPGKLHENGQELAADETPGERQQLYMSPGQESRAVEIDTTAARTDHLHPLLRRSMLW